MNHLQPISRFRVSALSAGLFIACMRWPDPRRRISRGRQLVDDAQDNVAIQARRRPGRLEAAAMT